MSIRDEVLNYLLSTNLVDNYIKKIAFSNDYEQIEDITQEIWLQICEVSEEKWEQLLNQGTEKDKFTKCRAFTSGLIHRNIRSKNSKVWYKLKKHTEREILKDSEIWNGYINTIADEPFNYDIEIN